MRSARFRSTAFRTALLRALSIPYSDPAAQIPSNGARPALGSSSARDAGIPSNFHNDATWREMAKWVELGVSAMETIQSATLWPARALRAEDRIGVLVAGRYADVIAVRGDPLTDMTVMRDVRVVVQGGKRVR